jgi:hypothetical protein
VRILILVFSACMVCAAFAQETQQTPQVQPQQQQQPERAPQSPERGTEPAATPAPATPVPAPAPAGAAAAGPTCPCEPRHAGPEATEYWPPIRGYRLKITDTLIAGFMALLFFATWQLWLATRRLVRNADLNAERQLRAYLAASPKTFTGFRANATGRIDWTVKNLGQTPAQKISHRYDWAVLPHPLPARHKFDEPSREVAGTSALLPKDETVSNCNGVAPFTAQQIEAVSRNEARVYCWGHIEYDDVFRVRWRSRFSVSVGGEAFTRAMTLPADHPSAPPWSWEFGNGHNEIEQVR